nr:phytanoyl-CoA dioxygenase family protein [Gaetbulibacter sp. 4G1]
MELREKFLSHGFTHLESLIVKDEVEELRVLYDDLLKDKKRTEGLRSDLSGGSGGPVEKITQIMRPSLIEPKLSKMNVYKQALNYAKLLLGSDMALDFDMLINKAPYTNTETPWHQDAAYWIKMPDKRAVSCWVALDDVYEANGCMWFIPKKKSTNILKHYAMPNKGALFCKTDTKEAQSIPLNSGGCTFHDGFTLHFSKGNSTNSQRRALILNFRPESMIVLEREQGVDHTGDREIRNKK